MHKVDPLSAWPAQRPDQVYQRRFCMNHTRVVGIDVAKNSLEVCLRGQDQTSHRQFSNAPEGYQALDRWLRQHAAPALPVCLEATGQYGEGVAEFLHQQ